MLCSMFCWNLLLWFIFPWKRALSFIWKKLESPLPKGSLYHVWLNGPCGSGEEENIKSLRQQWRCRQQKKSLRLRWTIKNRVKMLTYTYNWNCVGIACTCRPCYVSIYFNTKSSDIYQTKLLPSRDEYWRLTAPIWTWNESCADKMCMRM